MAALAERPIIRVHQADFAPALALAASTAGEAALTRAVQCSTDIYTVNGDIASGLQQQGEVTVSSREGDSEFHAGINVAWGQAWCDSSIVRRDPSMHDSVVERWLHHSLDGALCRSASRRVEGLPLASLSLEEGVYLQAAVVDMAEEVSHAGRELPAPQEPELIPDIVYDLYESNSLFTRTGALNGVTAGLVDVVGKAMANSCQSDDFVVSCLRVDFDSGSETSANRDQDVYFGVTDRRTRQATEFTFHAMGIGARNGVELSSTQCMLTESDPRSGRVVRRNLVERGGDMLLQTAVGTKAETGPITALEEASADTVLALAKKAIGVMRVSAV